MRTGGTPMLGNHHMGIIHDIRRFWLSIALRSFLNGGWHGVTWANHKKHMGSNLENGRSMTWVNRIRNECFWKEAKNTLPKIACLLGTIMQNQATKKGRGTSFFRTDPVKTHRIRPMVLMYESWDLSTICTLASLLMLGLACFFCHTTS